GSLQPGSRSRASPDGHARARSSSETGRSLDGHGAPSRSRCAGSTHPFPSSERRRYRKRRRFSRARPCDGAERPQESLYVSLGAIALDRLPRIRAPATSSLYIGNCSLQGPREIDYSVPTERRERARLSFGHEFLEASNRKADGRNAETRGLKGHQ